MHMTFPVGLTHTALYPDALPYFISVYHDVSPNHRCIT